MRGVLGCRRVGRRSIIYRSSKVRRSMVSLVVEQEDERRRGGDDEEAMWRVGQVIDVASRTRTNSDPDPECSGCFFFLSP